MNQVEMFNHGYELGLDVLGELAQTVDATPQFRKDALAGMMTAVMNSVYAMAPTEEAAEELITFAQRVALDNWEKEKNSV